ncbi:Protein kinase family protein [Prunus dulcis]|uniref:PREDICTED: rust resistance kinase n=1 Tax=Prunus dulcis TaxID=3755 RepID=A0A4Y1R560_PRUDU|nr:LEAF RUST 10 DISEASE-RESISTANCE LOCUS RECEPTOR-LIKE PROTEIN KINASE-like 2.2 [Prunus dulcis]KAI5337443.1 hypothetical protein L3X38_016714 [Prunus dulcis]BBG99127.1 Protein kinase family protein [Prunus dulcis]VVA19840.1 PREDICTED: rust resistance kinase [Prunus dulcis]
MSSVDSFGGSSTSPDKTFNSSMDKIVAASVVSGVVFIIAVAAIICAIINCAKKAGSFPISARIVSSVDSTGKDSNQVAIDVRADQFPVKVDFPTTIKGFLSNMAREKPIAFSPKQIAEFTNNYSPANLLGSGAFGVVYKGLLVDGVEVAVKVLTNNNSAKIVEEQFMAEVGTLGRICHMNLVRLYGFCFDPELKALVYEYMENGSLDKLLFDENKQVELEKLHDIAVQIAQGLAYLHEGCGKRIIHYDIKPENVLLDENLNPKVADFGLAKLCNRGSSQMVLTNVRGTAGYAAPDVWKPYPVTHKCDVYSFGIVLFEIVGRRRHLDVNANESSEWLPKWTWNMYNKNELAVLVSRCGIEEKDREKAERMFLVALLCIQNSPEERPLMSNVVKMLEGHMVIPPPPFPFEHGQSPPRNLSQRSGTDEDSNTSASSTKTSEINEIELAAVE